MKKVGKYVIISLLLLLGLCCVGVMYLFFMPNSTLFHITYINKHNTIQTNRSDINNVSTIKINSRAYDLLIVETEDETIHAEVFSNSFGFVLDKNKDVNVAVNHSGGVLELNVIEPHGFAIKNDSYIKVYIPNSKEFDLSINNISAKTTIKSSNLQINDLTYSTKSGSITLKNGTISGMLDIDLNSGSFNIGPEFVTNNNEVILKLTTGKFNATQSILGNVNIEKNNRGIININQCNTITDDVAVAGGQLNINKCFSAFITTSDTNVTIGEITSGAAIELTGSGKVSITTLSALSTVKTVSGNIKITNAFYNVKLESDTGNILVESATMLVSVTTNYGMAEIHFNQDIPHYSADSTIKTRVLHARIKDGKLIATGVEHIGDQTEETGIAITGNGSINLRMTNVKGTNSITGNSGNVYVVVDKASEFVLETQSNTGNVRVNLTQTEEFDGYTTKEKRSTNVNCETSVNSLYVTTTSGSLSLFDTNFA